MLLPEGTGPLLLVGAGKMGGAMLEGWLSNGLTPDGVMVRDPAPPPEMAALIREFQLPLNTQPDPDRPIRVIVLAVKPQMMAEVVEGVVPLAAPDTLVMSIAAGWTIANFEQYFGTSQPIIRIMPNTPASIGRGMLVACPNESVGDADRHICNALIASSGEVAWIDDESLMDAVTGVSGSGPAYVFYLAECLEQAGIAAGLPADLARLLARTTVSGAGELLHSSDLGADQLRKNVTSPNGTTAAALEVLMAKGGLEDLMREAVAAATKRSKELSG